MPRIVKILEMQSRGVFRGTDERTMVSLCLVGMDFHGKRMRSIKLHRKMMVLLHINVSIFNDIEQCT